MKNEIDIQIRVPNQTRYLRLIGNLGENLIRDLCESYKDHEVLAYNFNVVLTEAMSNAILHANTAKPDKEISVHIRISETELAIQVYDSGEGFNLNSIPMPAFDSNCLSESGRGLFIIKSLMDTVEYKKVEKGGNVLIMKKNLKQHLCLL